MINAIKDKVVTLLMIREKTASGLILPSATSDPQAFCKVLSVGEDVTTVKVGDIVVSHVRGGMDVVLDQEVIKVLKEEEIYGILTHEPTISTLQEIKLVGKSEGISKIQPISKPRIIT